LRAKKKERGAATSRTIHKLKNFSYANTTTFPPDAPFLGNSKAPEIQPLKVPVFRMGHLPQ
jgi:hypothetical protein